MKCGIMYKAMYTLSYINIENVRMQTYMSDKMDHQTQQSRYTHVDSYSCPGNTDADVNTVLKGRKFNVNT